MSVFSIDGEEVKSNNRVEDIGEGIIFIYLLRMLKRWEGVD